MKLRDAFRRFAILGLAACAAACGGDGSEEARVPEEVVRQNVLGTAHLGQQKWAEAEASFRSALSLAPDDPLLHTNLAVALFQQSRIEEARLALEQALARDPDSLHAHYNLGLIRSREGNFEAAIRHFETVERADPGDLHTQYYLGTALARVGREREAVARLRKALELDPSHVSTLYGLGRLLLQLGEQDEGKRLVERSQEMRARSGLDQAVGNQYGDQGPYALGVDYPAGGLAAPAAIAVTFARGASVTAPADAAWTVGPGPDGTAVLWAAGNDGLVRLGASGPPVSMPPLPGGGSVRALAAGDLDREPDLEIVALAERASDMVPLVLDDAAGAAPAWVEPTSDGTSGDGGSAARADLTLVDRDHDGDLDAFWCSSGETSGCRIGTNDGSGAFAVSDASAHGLTADALGGSVHVGFSDHDGDRDIDLIVGSDRGVHVLSNQRDGTFTDVTATSNAAKQFTIADLDKDGSMDLVVAGAEGVRLHPNRRGKYGEPVSIAEGAATGVVVFDFDNDGFLDVVHGAAGKLALHRNLGQGRWEKMAAEPVAGATEPLVALDADRDGDLDLAVRTSDGIALATNDGGNARAWIDLASKGVGDNLYAIGTRVEVLAGALRQKFEITRPLPVHAGLGDRDQVQSARYLWPSGVLQDEINLAARGTAEIAQLDRKGTSCPLLYAWRGGSWHFVTDFLGGCAIGYQLAPGIFNVPDTDEYVRIDGGLEPGHDGTVRVRLNNQLEEVIWFDQVDLLAVDHPPDVVVYPDERLMPGPPWPAFRLLASRDVRPIVSARGDRGQDVTEILSERDRSTVDDFATFPFQGYAARHALELDLGALPARGRVVLLLDGWIDYADSTANVAASQAGLVVETPRLEVADGRGGWVDRTRGRMGFPAGLPKTMTVDLTGAFPSRSARVRITTNMRIYWDRARTMVGGEEIPLDVTRLRAHLADLRYGGFPRETSPDGRRPFAYDPARVDDRSPWKTHAGAYTAFGDVRSLLAAIDDRFVTTRNGDEIELGFHEPQLAEELERTWILFADGFGKDMDPNSAASDAVGPIPFHGMPRYPYGDDVVPPAPIEPDRPPRIVSTIR